MSSFWPRLAMVLALAYFSYHAYQGDRGLRQYEVLQNKIIEYEAELAGLHYKAKSLKADNARLDEASLDLVYLKDQAHAIGLLKEGEYSYSF